MQVKMLIIFDYDPETNEYKPIKQEIVEEGENLVGKKKTSTKSTIKDDGSTEAEIVLEDNKLVLNFKAVELLGAEWEDRISVRYEKQGDYWVPVIGKDEAFQCKGGNKLTKSKTIAYRGKANAELAKHGSTFKMIECRDGIYILDGGIKIPILDEPKKRTDVKIKVVEDENSNEVLPMEATLDQEGNTEISETFTFEL